MLETHTKEVKFNDEQIHSTHMVHFKIHFPLLLEWQRHHPSEGSLLLPTLQLLFQPVPEQPKARSLGLHLGL